MSCPALAAGVLVSLQWQLDERNLLDVLWLGGYHGHCPGPRCAQTEADLSAGAVSEAGALPKAGSSQG